MSSFLDFLIQYKFVLAFYLGLILFIYLNRRKFEFQAKFIALKRTKLGLKLMDRWGTKYGEFIRLLGIIGIGVCFIGIILMIPFVIWLFIQLFVTPEAPAAFAPFLPGVKIPGSPITVPLVQGLVALFIVVVIHEFSHGVVARANKIPVLNSGIVFFGPLIGAFVEPDEKKLTKETDVVKYSVFAAGPFSNFVSGAIFLLIFSLIFAPITSSMVDVTGFTLESVEPDLPADLAGLVPGSNYTIFNGEQIMNKSQFTSLLSQLQINKTITIGNSTHNYNVTPIENPEQAGKPLIGISFMLTTKIKESVPKWIYYILFWIQDLIFWIVALSLGLGAANLLSIGPLDGGRMTQVASTKIFGKKKGTLIWAKTSVILLFIVLILVLLPIIRSIF